MDKEKEQENQSSHSNNSENNNEPTQEISLEQENRMKEAVAKQNKLMIRHQQRVVSLALLEGSMRFRQGYYLDDIDDYRNGLVNEVMNYDGKKDKGWEKRAAKKIDFMVIEFKNKQERLNREMDNLVKEITAGMTEAYKQKFDNYVTGLSMIVEEFMVAKNTKELITLAKLYNQGLLDSVFAGIPPKPEEQPSNEPAEEVKPIENKEVEIHDQTKEE